MKKIRFILIQKYAVSPNEQAFTLIEVLFAFSIFTIIAFFITPTLQIMLNSKGDQPRIQEMEWEVFCGQIKKEIRMSTHAEVVAGRLVLTDAPDTVIYEKYGNNLRRRVNYTGNETLLQNVSEYTFTIMNNSVKVTVKDIWGKEYAVSVYSLINWNAAS
ncbi:prepilin-type N-terminal cleavage/methylation domain-containing protein [Neobacillus pocheonensis]|uniref:Prepilin-type N-terminal cleavage/methylation domain-containing protein n=1 Tax=Neobacillus pocheonensis TaxID=363869 RepID=A0ABT0W5R6_9BACI|nr:prepilin-type N-terminal cleavage/methylation domain-containing protein [Neobacillus pocheonensis]